MNKNSENPKVGRLFQGYVCEMMSKHFEQSFDLEVAIPIGKPAKNHKFDCASEDEKIVVECKCYTWTETGNSPSAKLGALNEAVFYMSYLPDDTKKIIVIKKSRHPKKSETLAEYYYRTYRHLLEGITLMEVDIETGKLRVLE